jgi:hypothetical protein
VKPVNEKEVKMKKPNILIHCAVAAFLCFSVSVWGTGVALVFAGDGYGDQEVSGGKAAEAERDSILLEFMKDERLVEVEQQYAAAILEKVAEAEATPDPAEAERLQREIHDTKAEAELAAKEVMLDIAIEQADEEKIARLQEDLDLLYNPQKAQPDSGTPVRAADDNSFRTVPRSKQPDDQ